ncbi:MAG: DNA (cytosine-5-)-methyltransferase, partial [Candidatus Woesearchaeota archaeon]|nr:DNA (cytosine-5-)-methyltransferase [Candidatus Woesearchaeota archaeon]
MKIISLFCGAGGMDLGFIKAGHDIVWANDHDPDSCSTYEKYFNHKPYCGDIEKVSSKDIPNGHVVIGGFPCQGFSVANKFRNSKDERNKLYLELLRVITDKNPKYFIAENVPGLCSLGGYDNIKDKKERKGRVFKIILNELANAGKKGYHVTFDILNAADFGVPQNRKRVLILGTRKDVFPVLKHPSRPKNLKRKTVKDTISDLQKPTIWKKGISIEKQSTNGIFNHFGTKHKVKINGHLGNRKTEWNKP